MLEPLERLSEGLDALAQDRALRFRPGHRRRHGVDLRPFTVEGSLAGASDRGDDSAQGDPLEPVHVPLLVDELSLEPIAPIGS
ncbi:MAG TPA: hypothetical protein VFY98_14210, partial [Intrasporangium sp.]|nr:hypothetical protein [Intrasporangium sp.]